MKTNSVRKKLDGERNMKDIDPYSLAERASTVLADETLEEFSQETTADEIYKETKQGERLTQENQKDTGKENT